MSFSLEDKEPRRARRTSRSVPGRPAAASDPYPVLIAGGSNVDNGIGLFEPCDERSIQAGKENPLNKQTSVNDPCTSDPRSLELGKWGRLTR
jgi:hypothetical protein